MNDVVNAISFVMDVLVASLFPAAMAGIVLKVQKKRRVYPTGAQGADELRRDGNRLIVFFNVVYIVWLLSDWISTAIIPISIPLIVSLLKICTVLFYTVYFFNHPLKVTAIPDIVIAASTWIGELVDAGLESSSGYRRWKDKVLAARVSKEDRMLAFSGPEIGVIKRGQQLILGQTQFKCHSCGLEKDNSHLADVLQDERGQLLYFCDDPLCRVKVRDIYSKLIAIWRSDWRPADV